MVRRDLGGGARSSVRPSLGHVQNSLFWGLKQKGACRSPDGVSCIVLYCPPFGTVTTHHP